MEQCHRKPFEMEQNDLASKIRIFDWKPSSSSKQIWLGSVTEMIIRFRWPELTVGTTLRFLGSSSTLHQLLVSVSHHLMTRGHKCLLVWSLIKNCLVKMPDKSSGCYRSLLAKVKINCLLAWCLSQIHQLPQNQGSSSNERRNLRTAEGP